MLKEMASMAAECIRHPSRHSIWLPDEGRYVCPETDEARRHLERRAAAAAAPAVLVPVHPPLNPRFKLVFLTAAGGTLLFVLLCVVLSVVTTGAPPSLQEKLVGGFFDLAKIGFGAIVGLLGGQQLHAAEQTARSTA